MPSERAESRVIPSRRWRRVAGPETSADRCARYRRLRIPAQICPGTGLIVVPLADSVDSVSAPAGLGRDALAALAARAQLGPVVEHVRTARMTFLTAADSAPGDITGDRRLLHLNVTVGSRIAVLPAPLDEQIGARRWASAPDSVLPTTAVVIGALAEAATRDGAAPAPAYSVARFAPLHTYLGGARAAGF